MVQRRCSAKMKLAVTLEQDEDGFYVVECPTLPGCLSQGRTEEEALANIKEAIRGWLEVETEKIAKETTNGVKVCYIEV